MLSRLPLSFIVRLPVTIIARYRRLPRRAMGITEGMAEGNAPAPGPTETITFRDRDFLFLRIPVGKGGNNHFKKSISSANNQEPPSASHLILHILLCPASGTQIMLGLFTFRLFNSSPPKLSFHNPHPTPSAITSICVFLKHGSKKHVNQR